MNLSRRFPVACKDIHFVHALCDVYCCDSILKTCDIIFIVIIHSSNEATPSHHGLVV
jgi:hypothetical protein